MRTRALRIAVLALLIVSAVVAVLFLKDIDRRSADLLAARDMVETRLATMRDTLAAMGAAQQSYVAPGQQAEPWFERMSALVQQLYDEMNAVRGELRSTEAAPALNALAASMEELLAADSRARENLRLAQPLMAADVIFSDGQSTLDALAAELRGLREAEQQTFQAEHAALATERWTILWIALLVWAGGLLLLAAGPRAPAAAQPLADTPPVQELPAPLPASQPAPSPIHVDLDAAAAVCTDLSRLTTADGLRELLGRAAAVLDASGAIVWMGAGEELFAVVAHGYEPALLGRIRPLSRQDQNATAEAWRTGRLVTVEGDTISTGAIVAPMFGPDACIGALSFEVQSGRESEPSSKAVAGMIAAQLSTAVAAWPAPSGEAAPVADDPASSPDPTPEYRSAAGN